MAHAWGFSWDQTYSGSDVSDFRLTSDLVSKGYEFELNAQITDSWRLTANASRIESVIDNIGQTLAPGGKMTVIDYMLDFDRRLNETAMGDLRIWGPGGSANARENWNGYADGDLKARLAEQGTVVPENRLWHINLITNYDFHHGLLRGWSLGGGVRYQSAATLGYKPIQNPGYISYDLNSPFKDDPEYDFDLWVGYNRKLFNNKIDWRVQLNVANVGVGNELIPVTVQPDGTPAAYRIRPPQQIFLTNTFSF
jgi:outer membrane receptor for ferric coprogen and ferric-rhodotorulic acid